MRTATISAVILGFVLAGCGSSGNAKEHQAAVNYCVSGPQNGGQNESRSSCECAVKNAEKQGYSDQKVLSEMTDGTMISDKKLLAIGFFCVGR